MTSDAYEFHIRLLRKPGVGADLCSDGLPGVAVNAEIRLVDKDDEVWIAGGNHGSLDGNPAGHVQEARSHLGKAHGGSDAKDLIGAVVDAAYAAAGIGFEDDLIARASLGFIADPGGRAPGSIAGYFGDGAVGVVQPYPGLALVFPGEELDSIGSDALGAVTESPGEGIPGFHPG